MDRYLLSLGIIYTAFWAVMALSPLDRGAWLLENILVFVSVPVIALIHHRIRLSRISYSMLFLFFCLHTVGSHYTYSLVPYDEFWQWFNGHSLNDAMSWERNHFDRFVHLAFGLLLTYPMREIFVRIANARGFWGYFLPIIMTLSLSTLYELIEWAAAVAFGGDLGIHYLGTQGDEWDGQRDMALAGAGAVIAMLVTMAVNLSLQRDFAVEWRDSLRVKDKRPLGEEAIARMLHEQDEPEDPRW